MSALFGLGSLGCEVEEGSGVIVSRQRSIPELSRVSVCCGFEVDFKIGEEPELVVKTDDNLIDEVEVEVDDGLLEIEWDDEPFFYSPSQPVRLELTLPRLTRFYGSGGMQLRADDVSSEGLVIDLSGGSRAHMSQVWVDDLRVTESGGSRIEFDLISAKRTVVDSSGGSIFEAQGLSSRLFSTVSGGGKLRAADLIADHVKLDLSGGSYAAVTALSTLDAEASGGSVIELSGDPERDVDLSGGSELR